jgi:uncharacterized lipoprotein YddW (UPF0748 family)
LLILGALPLRAQDLDVVGVWLSPDWLFPGTRQYTEEAVRAEARRTVRHLSGLGVNAIFLETWLRGYSIASAVETQGFQTRPLPYQGERGLPLYRHLSWPFRTTGNEVQDTLQIFIDEARTEGIQVHAWVHCFYWKMDNTPAMLPWHSGLSMWNDLMATWLRREADRLQGSPGAAPATLALMREAAALYDRTNEDRELEKILERYRIAHDHHPMGALLTQALRAGATPPDFLLVSDIEDPFPAPRNKALRPVFLNPENPEVQRRLRRVVRELVKGHPGLAGIHLDHVRYPVDGQGLPPELGIQSGSYNYYSSANPVLLQKYHACKAVLAHREQVLTDLVAQLRQELPRRYSLSAAVLPLYYRERDNGRFRLSGYDFACQDWYRWDIDFVVPMMYEFHPYVIRGLMKMWAADMEQLYGRQTIAVYPGVSRWQMARSGLLDVHTWVFFDLTLARDVKIENEVEDLNFGEVE